MRRVTCLVHLRGPGLRDPDARELARREKHVARYPDQVDHATRHHLPHHGRQPRRAPSRRSASRADGTAARMRRTCARGPRAIRLAMAGGPVSRRPWRPCPTASLRAAVAEVVQLERVEVGRPTRASRQQRELREVAQVPILERIAVIKGHALVGAEQRHGERSCRCAPRRRPERESAGRTSRRRQYEGHRPIASTVPCARERFSVWGPMPRYSILSCPRRFPSAPPPTVASTSPTTRSSPSSRATAPLPTSGAPRRPSLTRRWRSLLRPAEDRVVGGLRQQQGLQPLQGLGCRRRRTARSKSSWSASRGRSRPQSAAASVRST